MPPERWPRWLICGKRPTPICHWRSESRACAPPSAEAPECAALHRNGLPCAHYTTGEFPFNIIDRLAMCGFLRRNL